MVLSLRLLVVVVGRNFDIEHRIHFFAPMPMLLRHGQGQEIKFTLFAIAFKRK